MNLKNSIVSWLPMDKKSRVLCVNLDDSVVKYLLAANNELSVTNISLDVYASLKSEYCVGETTVISENYDIIIAIDVIENSSDPTKLLSSFYERLSEGGILYLGTDNRMGIRYFSGDMDPHTKTSFQGLEKYRALNQQQDFLPHRAYAKYEINNFLENAGFRVDGSCKYYSVLPNLSAAQLIYAEDYLPKECLSTRYIPMYRDPSRIFIHEEWLYDSLIQNGMFHQMANSYLVECHKDETEDFKNQLSNIQHVTLSMNRGEEYACATIIYPDKVVKKALFPQGVNRLRRIWDNDNNLRVHNVPVITSKIEDGIYTMPNINANTLEVYMQHLLVTNIDAFLHLFDQYRDILYHSSDVLDVTDHGPIMARCYIDLVPLNCFYKDGEFIFYDQEFYIEKMPIDLVLWRAMVIVYDGDITRNSVLSIYELAKHYGIDRYIDEYSKMSSDFLRRLRNQSDMADFNIRNVRDISRVNENQRKIEEIMIDWDEFREKCKETCFDNLEGKEIFVFGSGRYADEFICMYRYDYRIVGVLDNSADKQGQEMYGYSIFSPGILCGKNPEKYKVIVCVKNCADILMQLKRVGCRYIGIFDINYVYPGRQKYLPGSLGLNKNQKFYELEPLKNIPTKKYHIGYIAGVFDLYHLGHLNMFRRAKEYCDYLIVGVVSDDGVRINKQKEPFIPFDERIEMVRSCMYVDEAVEIPFVYCRTPEAFRKYHFDVQFSGSDYEHDPDWIAMKDFLERNGSTMIFFPYTQQTSSTKIKSLIDRGLL